MDDPVQRVHDLIARELPRRQSNRVLHAHPSPTLWLERDVPVADILRDRPRSESGPRRRLLVYVGTPYCLPTTPDRCGFCLFPSEVYRGPEQLTTYLRYLACEAELYRPWLEDTEAVAVYFGGGTTNLYRPREYGELMTLVRKALPRAAPDLEVTVEGVAQLFTRPKLEAMREAGITRVSMGVQQFDPDLLKLSGRKQDIDHVLRMIELCQTLGLGVQRGPHLRMAGPVPRAHVPRPGDRRPPEGAPHHPLRAERRRANRLRAASRPAPVRRPESRDVPDLEGLAGSERLSPGDAVRLGTGGCRVRPASFGTRRWPGHRSSRTPDGSISGYDVWGWGFAGLSRWFGAPRDRGWVTMNSPRVEAY